MSAALRDRYRALADCYRRQRALAEAEECDVDDLVAVLDEAAGLIADCPSPPAPDPELEAAIADALAAHRAASAALDRHRRRLGTAGAAITRQSAALRAYARTVAPNARYIDQRR